MAAAMGWTSTFILLFLLVGPSAGNDDGKRKLTEREKQVMRKGIEAGKKFTHIMKTGSFADGMAEVEPFVIGWTDILEIVGEILDAIFEPDDDRILQAIKQGFRDVNRNLDDIKSQLEEIIQVIKWADMKVKFADIESRIRLLDSKIKDMMRAPDSNDGIDAFLDTYDRSYRDAGFALYDAIVSNNQVFTQNLLAAAREYGKNHRPATRKFMRGLLSLIVKAVNIEVLQEKLMKEKRGVAARWRRRMLECRDAMKATDKVLTDAWSTQFKLDVADIAYRMKEQKHETFARTTHNFLKKKFDWKNWHVLAYNPVEKAKEHALKHDGSAYVSFRGQNKRNILVVASDPQAEFSPAKAKSYIKDYRCWKYLHQCIPRAGQELVELTPDYGVAKAFVRNNHKQFMISDRSATGVGWLTWAAHRHRVGKFNMYYFG